jgi:hypothetical protein
LGIGTKVAVSSNITIDHDLKGQDKVLALCGAMLADTYVNPIGGIEIYASAAFSERGIALKFLKSNLIEYPQFEGEFVPWLSIIDVMMFNSIDIIRNRFLNNYELI